MFSQNEWSLGWYSKHAPPKYRPRKFPLHKSAHVIIIIIIIIIIYTDREDTASRPDIIIKNKRRKHAH